MLCFPVCKFNHSHGQQCCPSELNYPNRRDGQKSAGYGKQTPQRFEAVQAAVFHGFPSPFSIRAPHFTPIFFASLK